MPDFIMTVREDLCTGCKICELICSFVRYAAFSPKQASISIIQDKPFNKIEVCRQCTNAVCIKACPRNAIHKKGNLIIIDENLCNGCGFCVKYCPWNAIKIDFSKRAVKCDFCGGDPRCIKYCPTKAISLIEKGGRGEIF